MKKSITHTLKKVFVLFFALILADAVISFCVLQKQNAEKTFVEDNSIEEDVNEEVKESKVQAQHFSSLSNDGTFYEFEFIYSKILVKHKCQSLIILQTINGCFDPIYSPPDFFS